MTENLHNSLQQKTVLIVDDTPDNLAVLGKLLMPYYKVRIANSGPRALASALIEPLPDLILLDIMMPGMDGYEVLKRLKEKPETQEIPVIFITALDQTEDEEKGLELGAVDFIPKPIRPPIFLARVKGQLDIKEARDHLRDKNSWLENEVRRRIRQFQKVQDISMRALACLAEARDNETGNHIRRTQEYVNILAKELALLPQYAEALTPDIIETYTKAAPLHDIGKVGIPDHVLHKPGKHTPEEWEIMKTHAQVGADAIWHALQDEDDMEAVDFLYVAMDIAGNHHEKWDGSGYPKGKSGDEIPLSARLMAIADVFDALISRRIYKPPFSIETALEMIIENSGTHFDPDIVDAFKRRIEDFRAIAARYEDIEPPGGQS